MNNLSIVRFLLENEAKEKKKKLFFFFFFFKSQGVQRIVQNHINEEVHFRIKKKKVPDGGIQPFHHEVTASAKKNFFVSSFFLSCL